MFGDLRDFLRCIHQMKEEKAFYIKYFPYRSIQFLMDKIDDLMDKTKRNESILIELLF